MFYRINEMLAKEFAVCDAFLEIQKLDGRKSVQ